MYLLLLLRHLSLLPHLPFRVLSLLLLLLLFFVGFLVLLLSQVLLLFPTDARQTLLRLSLQRLLLS